MPSALQGDEPPTDKQERVLERVLRWYWEREGMNLGLSLSDVATELGMHYVSMKQHLKFLHRKGLIYFESRGAGKWPILRPVTLRKESKLQ